MNEHTPVYRVDCIRTATHMAQEAVLLYMRGFGQERLVNCYFWLIRGGGLHILVDTGLGGEYPADYPDAIRELSQQHQHGFPVAQGEDTVSRLRAYGVTPDDIDIVILSHLHFDHAGNIPLFKRARIAVNRKGWAFARQPGKHPVFNVAADALLNYMETEMGGQLSLVEDEAEIVPGIRVVWTGGHTVCSQAVLIDTAKGRVVLTGDVAYLYDNLEQDHPIGLAVSLFESVAALRRLKAEGDILLPGHDAAILVRYPGGVIAQ